MQRRGMLRIFSMIDDNRDGYLSCSEIKALIVGIEFNEINLDENDDVERVMKDFDTTRDSRVNLDEFEAGVAKWLQEARDASGDGVGSSKYIDDFHLQTKIKHDILGNVQSDEFVEEVKNPRWTTFKAALLLLLGTVIATAFAEPSVDAVDNFSVA